MGLHQFWLWPQSTASPLLRPTLPHGMGITGTDGLRTTMAIMERGQPMLSQQQLLRLMPSPGGTDLTGMAAMERDLLTLDIRVKKVDTRNDELHQAKQSWTMAKQEIPAERNQYHYIGSLNCYIGYLVSPIDKK